MLKDIITAIRLHFLRRKVRRIVKSIYAMLDNSTAGAALTIQMRPAITRSAEYADRLLDKCAKLDPDNAPKDRVMDMLRELSR